MSLAKPIILICGPSGAGKSTLARELEGALKLDHRLGVGFVREVVRTETDTKRDPALFLYSFGGDDPIATLRSQAERLKPAVSACIERAYDEGTSLVVEGTHLLPELYHDHPHVTGFVVLQAPHDEEHRRRIMGPSHARRQLSHQTLTQIVATSGYFTEQAQLYGIPSLGYQGNLSAILSLLKC
jgi:2-phosphoglycerate kinase